MSKVLPEFVNNIMNKVTSNNTAGLEDVTPSGNNTTTRRISSNNRPSTSSSNNNMNIQSAGPNNNNRVKSSSNGNNMNMQSAGPNNNNRVKSSSNTGHHEEPGIDSASKFDNLSNAGHMRELLDSVVASNLPVDKRNRLLTVIKSALVPTQAQENQDFNRMSQRYDFTNPNYMQPGYFPAVTNMGMTGGIPAYNPPYMMMQQPGMMNYAPPPYYNMQPPHQQAPGVMYDILFNKMNMMQMEMADLTRHLRDYTRRYMDNMRESDMSQLKVYIDELMKVQESVSQLAPEEEPLPEPEPEEETTPSGVIDKAKSTLKSGLSKVTDTVNSIGNTLGLTSEAAKDEDLEAEPDIDDNEIPEPSSVPSSANSASLSSGLAAAESAPSSSQAASNQPASKQSNMVSLEDYDIGEQQQQQSQAPSSSQRQDASSGMPVPQSSSTDASSSQRQNASSGMAPSSQSPTSTSASQPVSSANKSGSSGQVNKKTNITKAPLVSAAAGQSVSAEPAELSDAITELNKKNQSQQQGGGNKLKGKQSKKNTSILDQFEKMFKIKRQTKKQPARKKSK